MCKRDYTKSKGLYNSCTEGRAAMATEKLKTLIGYVRVSTSQQGRSGLGLEPRSKRWTASRASLWVACSLR
jgi:hypothetical protein